MSIGPVELVVLRFRGIDFSGEILPEIQRVVDAGIVRIIDVLLAVRVGDEPVHVLEMVELKDEVLQRFEPVVADVTGLLNHDDARHLSADLGPDSSAAVLLFEHAWASRIADAVAASGGEVIFSERIPRAVIEELVAEVASAA
jgi:hypothetical protein